MNQTKSSHKGLHITDNLFTATTAAE